MGLVKAAMNAASGVMADQWKEATGTTRQCPDSGRFAGKYWIFWKTCINRNIQAVNL